MTPPEQSSFPERELPAEEPSFRERGRMRRRARYLRALREVQLRDLGGFVLELHRFGRERSDLVSEKVAGAAETDRELRALERAIAQEVPVSDLRVPGVGGKCGRCGALHGSSDRFCAACGAPLLGAEHSLRAPTDGGEGTR